MGARFARWWVCGDGRTGRRVTSDDLLARPPETKRVDANKKSNATGVGLSLGGGTKGSAVAQRRPAVSWPPAHRSDSEKPARISVESEWQVLAKIRDTTPPPPPSDRWTSCVRPHYSAATTSNGGDVFLFQYPSRCCSRGLSPATVAVPRD